MKWWSGLQPGRLRGTTTFGWTKEGQEHSRDGWEEPPPLAGQREARIAAGNHWERSPALPHEMVARITAGTTERDHRLWTGKGRLEAQPGRLGGITTFGRVKEGPERSHDGWEESPALDGQREARSAAGTAERNHRL